MRSEKLFKSKPGKLVAKGVAKKNVSKSQKNHPDLIGVFEDLETGKFKRIALWVTKPKMKDDKQLNFQITELDEDYIPSKGDLF